VNGATAVVQPIVTASNFSPKATLTWAVTRDWAVTASVGNAYRYPTAGELYQLVSTGAIYTSPNPNLQPEKVWSEELKAERKLAHGLLRVSLFQEDVTHALISQYSTLVANSPTLYQYVMNVGRLRNKGVEVYADQDNVLIHGLELSGSVTFVNSRILENSGQGQFGSTIGKRAPYVPNWRATFAATYRPSNRLAITVAGRYSGRQYSTVDNTDVNPHTYGGFDDFFVLDTHANFTLSQHWEAEAGVDNLLNRKYFLFHPFPQRTVVAELKYHF
jgi:iron complex outermembrane receptor protein